MNTNDAPSPGGYRARVVRRIGAARRGLRSSRGARLVIEPPKLVHGRWLIRLSVHNAGPAAIFEAAVTRVEGMRVPARELPWVLSWRGRSTHAHLESGKEQLVRLALFRPQSQDFVVFEATGTGEPERRRLASSSHEILLNVRVRRGSRTVIERRVRLAVDEQNNTRGPVVTFAPESATAPLPPDDASEESQHFAEQDNELLRATSWQAIPYLARQVGQLFDMGAYLERHLADRDAPVALTLACGDMRGEYPLFKRVGVAHIDAVDVSEGQRQKFLRDVNDGVIPVDYKIANANEIELEPERYDLVYLQHAYHHVEALEHVADEIAKSLKPGGIFAITDYVGANFLQRTPSQRDLCGAIWRALPERYRAALSGDVVPELRIPIKHNLPPYEAVRSEEIREVLAERFEALEMVCYAGILVPIFNGFAQHYTNSKEDQDFIRLMWELDRWLLAAGQVEPDYMKAILIPRAHA